MSKMGLTKAQLKLVKEFKDTDDYKQLQYKLPHVRPQLSLWSKQPQSR